MLFTFFPSEEQFTNLIPSFLLGFRFDMRWISLALLPIVIASLSPVYSPFYSETNRKCWTWYLAFITFIVVFFFAADFGCFSYNETRLNASALNFAEDPGTSLIMMWESYPLLLMLFALFTSLLLLRWMFRITHVFVINQTNGRKIRYQRKWFVLATLLFAFFIYGGFSFQPLKWNNAFVLQDGFRSYLALNPFQNFFTTLKFRNLKNDNRKGKDHFPTMKAWMALPPESVNYNRKNVISSNAITTSPNVVLVLCESFSMYKSSMSGNPLNTTPFFNSLTRGGVFFDHCFAPHFSTARGLFATVTGIPDVQLSKFSTRNPEALNQHTIINEFKGYQKMYLLGGDPRFNNFEGLLKNIEGLEMITAGSFKSEPVNVWGISDKDLFLEANKRFAKKISPFFAIVQTADNHRPFRVPANEKEFKMETVPVDLLNKYGFDSLDEYNAFRYSDFCFRKFMEAAKKEAYFDNTIFVFIGDHGVAGNAKAIYDPVWTSERLTDEHVPLLFYAPKLLKPLRKTGVVSQIDVLPTIAALTSQSFRNTTLGIDILNNRRKGNHAFIIHHDKGQIGMVSDNFYFIKNLNFTDEELHLFSGAVYSQMQQDSIKQKMSSLTTAFYETAKWMLVNNKREIN
jgi:phosphoglycerol transferase MdoB-like AlkP superfamily enzyme